MMLRYSSDDIPDLTPGVDRYPASQQPILRRGLSLEFVGVGVSADATGVSVWVPQSYADGFLVKVENDGGEAGEPATGTFPAVDCSFTYTVKDLAGVVLAEEVSPERARYPGTTYIAGADGDQSEYGWAAYDAEGDLLLLQAYGEIEQTTAC
jgi:hypothetical protein